MNTNWFRTMSAICFLAGELAFAGEKPGKNLVPNGDFEKGSVTPDGWQTIDGLSAFWVKDSDPKHGKVLKFDTTILQTQAYEWWAKIAAGASPKDAPKKIPYVGEGYDTLAGLDGVWFFSDFISIEKGKAYWLTMDAKGAGFLAWLVGYKEKESTSFGADAAAFQGFLLEKAGKFNNERNRKAFIHTYDWKGQLSVGGSDKWETYSRREKPFRPTAVFPDIRYVRVMIYPLWPPGDYYVDNVKLVEVEDKGEAK